MNMNLEKDTDTTMDTEKDTSMNMEIHMDMSTSISWKLFVEKHGNIYGG
jgi:hypothetical protein